MKNILIITAITICSINTQTSAQTPTPNDSEKAKMASINQRYKNGDKNALLEEADIRSEISVPDLSITAMHKSTDPEGAELARKALCRVKGVEDYLKQKIDAQSGKNPIWVADEQSKQLQILALVRTNKAIRIIASYLFDDKDVGYTAGDCTVEPLKAVAAMLLDNMNINGVPPNTQDTYDERVAVWRAWWLKNQGRFSDSNAYQGNK